MNEYHILCSPCEIASFHCLDDWNRVCDNSMSDLSVSMMSPNIRLMKIESLNYDFQQNTREPSAPIGIEPELCKKPEQILKCKVFPISDRIVSIKSERLKMT